MSTKTSAAPWRRDVDDIRDKSGAILAQGWPCVSFRRRRANLALMAAAPMMREALKNIASMARAIRPASAAQRLILEEVRAALYASRPHPAVSSGACDICGHYGNDCTGEK